VLGLIVTMGCLFIIADQGPMRNDAMLPVVCCIILIAFVCLFLAVRLVAQWCRRRGAERIIIGQVATVIRQNLPLATALALAGESERGMSRKRLQWIAGFLNRGVPLSAAIRWGYPECPSMVLSLILAGEQAGQLPAALRQAEEYLQDRARRRERKDTPMWPYGLVVIGTMVLVVSGIMIAVVPKFRMIFNDFEVRLPRPTMTLIDIAEWFLAGGTTPPGWVLFMPLLIVLPLVMYGFVRPRQVPDLHWSSRAADWIRWRVPGWGRMEYGSGMAAMLGVVRMAVRSGMSMQAAARLAADVDVNAAMRPRMRELSDLLGNGVGLPQAVRQARLGEVTAVALATGQRTGNMDASLRYATDYHSAIVSRGWLVVHSLAWPVFTLVLGSCVGFVVVALFLPLVTLINASTAFGR
jgi:type II secretory pathway component PulF